MSNYEQLIQKLNNENEQCRSEGFKKLIYLAVNDQRNFAENSARILKFVNEIIDKISNDENKLLALQLLSEIVSNYQSNIQKSTYDFDRIVLCLSDDKAQIRKASHYLILTFVKKYEKFDEILKSYLQIVEQEDISWKLTQKIIHSFQSLVIVQPKCITYPEDFKNLDEFLKFLFQRSQTQNNLLKKASEQAVTSFVKNQYVPQIIIKLDSEVLSKIVEYSKTLNIVLLQKSEISVIQQPQPQRIISEIEISKIKPKSIFLSEKKQTIQKQNIQEIKSPRFKQNSPKENRNIMKQSCTSPILLINKESEKILEDLIIRMQVQNEWNVKCSAIQQTYTYLQKNKLKQLPASLIERILDLTYDYNFKTCVTSLNTIHHFVTQYFLHLKQHMKRIQEILIEKICDMKLAIRQISSRVIKDLIKNQNQTILKMLINKLSNCSIIGKQEILNLMQQLYSQREQSEYTYVVGEICNLLYHENTRIKIKTIDSLVKITLGTDPEVCKKILSKKLNKVYYDMFVDRLNEKSNQKWEQKNKVGGSYQIQKTPFSQMDKPFFTRKQYQNKFLNSNKKNQMSQQSYKYPQLIIRDDTFYETKTTSKTMNTTNSQNIQITRKGRVTQQSKSTANSSNFGEFDFGGNIQMNNNQQKLKLIVVNTNNKNQEIIIDEEKKGKSTNQEKGYQYKPILSKKSKNKEMTQEQSIPKHQLIIESKEYKVKNPTLQQSKQKNFKLNTKPFMNKKPTLPITNEQEQEDKIEPKVPFKKSNTNSKSENKTIDYKATQYLTKQDLQPSIDPDKTLKLIYSDIKKDDDWSKQFEALNNIRRILKHHLDYYNNLISNMQTVMPEVLKLVQSLRSSLAKNAMITLSQMCECLRKTMDNYLEVIFVKLFKKTLDTNVFIAEEVKKCFNSLCNYCNSSKIISIILNSSQTKQSQIKMHILLVIQCLMDKTQNKIQLFKENLKLISIIGSYILDSNMEVRNYDKTIFIDLAKQTPKTQIQTLFKKNLNQEAFTKLKYVLEKEINNITLTGKTNEQLLLTKTTTLKRLQKMEENSK